MTLRTRIRKIIKWTALALTAVLLVCWIGSNWYYLQWIGEDELWSVGCYEGTLGGLFQEAGKAGQQATLHFEEADSNLAFEWGGWQDPFVPIRVSGVFVWYYGVPLWAPLLFAGSIAVAAWKLDRTASLRARDTCCKKCGYHRAGLKPLAACPECGTDGNDTSLPAKSP